MVLQSWLLPDESEANSDQDLIRVSTVLKCLRKENVEFSTPLDLVSFRGSIWRDLRLPWHTCQFRRSFNHKCATAHGSECGAFICGAMQCIIGRLRL